MTRDARYLALVTWAATIAVWLAILVVVALALPGPAGASP
jgi:hypothetical protein